MTHWCMAAHNRVQMGQKGQLGRVDAAVGPYEAFAKVWALVTSGVVPDHMDEPLVGLRASILARSCAARAPFTVVGSTKGAPKVSRSIAPWMLTRPPFQPSVERAPRAPSRQVLPAPPSIAHGSVF